MSIASMIARSGQTADVQRQTISTDEIGAKTRTWNAVKTNAPCWLQPAASAVVEHYANLELVVSHRCYFSQNPGTTQGDRLVVSRFGEDDRTLLVVAAQNQVELNRLWVVDVQETA